MIYQLREIVLINSIDGYQRKGLLSGLVIDEVEDMPSSSAYHLLPLAYLSPEVTRAVLAGRHRPDLNLEQIVRSGLSLSWAAQRRLFGLESAV